MAVLRLAGRREESGACLCVFARVCAQQHNGGRANLGRGGMLRCASTEGRRRWQILAF